MDRIFQVFVSSTFDDLRDERLQVSNALAKAGYIAAGMELFPASDQQQLEYIQRIINRSDYYVVVVGARYGSLADNGLSFTENEFDYARSKGIPVLAFLPADPSKIAAGKTETDAAKRDKLEAFKKKLKTGRIVEHWTSADDLCLKVVTAVAHAMNLTPRQGWVRGDNAVDPKVLQDLERLRIENEELRAKLVSNQEDGFDPSLIGPDDAIEIRFVVSSAGSVDGSGKYSNEHGIKLTVGSAFVSIYEYMRSNSRESSILTVLAAACAAKQNVKKEKASYSVTSATRSMLRRQFEGLDLIEVTSIQQSGFYSGLPPEHSWVATQKGRRYASVKLALPKDVAPASKKRSKIRKPTRSK